MSRNQGFTLIEVLVAILIVAVGILGVAGMQVVSLQQNRNALLRDTSLQLGNDILDRMRANRLEAYSPITFEATPSFTTNCNDNLCSREQMKDFDLANWKCRLNPIDDAGVIYPACDTLGIGTASLPEGRGSITGGADGTDYVVTVEWTADRDGNKSQVILRSVVTDIPVAP